MCSLPMVNSFTSEDAWGGPLDLRNHFDIIMYEINFNKLFNKSGIRPILL